MAKSYGIPMQGSKSRIADKIIDLLPSATHVYDLFGGGCALSHAALLSGKFQILRRAYKRVLGVGRRVLS